MLPKFIIIFLIFVIVDAKPVEHYAEILSQYNDLEHDGSYKFGYETSDGQKRDEAGDITNIGKEEGVLRVSGQYSYLGPDGKHYQVHYKADEHGFHPSGDHLPSQGGSSDIHKLIAVQEHKIAEVLTTPIPPPLAIPPAALISLTGG